MKFMNERVLLSNSSSESNRALRKDALEILKAVVKSADPREAVKRNLKVTGDTLSCGSVDYDLKGDHRIYVVGGGKAGAAMARAVWDLDIPVLKISAVACIFSFISSLICWGAGE